MKLQHEADLVGGSIAGNLYTQDSAATAAGAVLGDGVAMERLPFKVKVVRSEDELMKAIQIRQAAYARHVPAFAERLTAPEVHDHDEESIVLLAESKLDGSPLGTMRIQTNVSNPLALEHSVELPEWLQGRRLAEATRLGVSQGRIGKLVKITLFKAFLLYCLDEDIDWMVITARAPLDRQYDALLFEDVRPGQGYIPMAHVGGIPHRVMALEPRAVRARWGAANHPLFKYFFLTEHRDIILGSANAKFAAPGTAWLADQALVSHVQL